MHSVPHRGLSVAFPETELYGFSDTNMENNFKLIPCVSNQFDPNPLSYTELTEAVLSCYISTALILTEGLPLFDTPINVAIQIHPPQ